MYVCMYVCMSDLDADTRNVDIKGILTFNMVIKVVNISFQDLD
jgi:hypothetical protein